MHALGSTARPAGLDARVHQHHHQQKHGVRPAALHTPPGHCLSANHTTTHLQHQGGCCSAARALSRRSAALGTGLLIGGGLVAAAAAAAAAASFGGETPQNLVRAGMQKFRQNDVEASVHDFDRALQANPQMRPFLWQRGLSLYYLGQFQEAATQFRDDVAVNPNDTEESVWAFLCEAQLEGPDKARTNMLQVGRDPRPVMRAVYECFKTQGCSPTTILEAAGPDNGGHDTFYASLYVGLWHEAHGNAAEAQKFITAAAATQYARLSGDYMASLARVHCQRRGWPLQEEA